MKHLIALLLISTISYSQSYRNYTGSASQDTLKKVSTVTATSEAGKVKWIDRINFNTPVASDTIYLWQSSTSGTRYVGKWIFSSTAPAPFSIPLGCSTDSSYVIVKRFKTSDITIIYRY